MRELLYIEVPTPDLEAVKCWLHQTWQPLNGDKQLRAGGLRLQDKQANILSIFIWSVQRTVYLKCFRWGDHPFTQEQSLVKQLQQEIRLAFPPTYPAPPEIDLSQQSIFAALAPYYPQTVHFFQQMPEGEYDLNRVYWWEKRWRESVRHPQQPKSVIFRGEQTAISSENLSENLYDLIYIGGALGSIHAAVMAQRGYRVLLIERLPFGRMNREWNISRAEFQRLIDLQLFTAAEFESLIAREYRDGFNKFFDSYNPPNLKAKVLHTSTVLNIALDSAQLLQKCGEKLH